MKLTDAKCRTTRPKPSGKPRRLPDGQGLYLEVSKAGTKVWWLKYRLNGAEKRVSFERYPETSLAERVSGALPRAS